MDAADAAGEVADLKTLEDEDWPPAGSRRELQSGDVILGHAACRAGTRFQSGG
jgi:hypothetical protein